MPTLLAGVRINCGRRVSATSGVKVSCTRINFGHVMVSVKDARLFGPAKRIVERRLQLPTTILKMFKP